MSTHAADQRRDLRGPNLIGERSVLLMDGDPGPMGPLLGLRPSQGDLAAAWDGLSQIAAESRPLPRASGRGDGGAASESPVLGLALRLALSLFHRYEALAPFARVLVAQPSRLALAFGCEEHALAAHAWRLAVDAVTAWFGPDPSLAGARLESLRDRHRALLAHAERTALSADTLVLVRELRRRGMPVERLAEGFDIVQLGHGRLRRRFAGARLDLTSARAVRLVRAERAFRLALERAALPAAGDAAGTDFAVWVVSGRARAALRLDGGVQRDLEERLPFAAGRLAERCAAAMDLDPAVVRLRSMAEWPLGRRPDWSPHGDLAVVAAECSATLPHEGAPRARRAVSAALVDRLVEGVGDGRIPAIWLAGSAVAGPLAARLESLLRGAGFRPGMQVAGRARVAGEEIEVSSAGSRAGWPLVLLDARVDAAVIGFETRDVLTAGLGADLCDVAVWRGEHVGASVQRIPLGRERIVRSDALVLSRAREAVVLDADDARWPRMRAAVRAPTIWLASRRGPGGPIERHLAQGGSAAWLEAAGQCPQVVVRNGDGPAVRFAVRESPGDAGADRPAAADALFAIAAVRALGVAPEAIDRVSGGPSASAPVEQTG